MQQACERTSTGYFLEKAKKSLDRLHIDSTKNTYSVVMVFTTMYVKSSK